jgi:surface-anchored protein
MNQRRRHFSFAFLSLAFFAPVLCAASVPVYHAGHSDIGVDYLTSPPRFNLKIRFDGNAQFEDGASYSFLRVAPESVAIRAPDPPILRENYIGDPKDPDDDYDLSGPTWDFLGADQGEPVWFMPQTNDPAKPFFGFATDTLNIPQWSGPITWSLEEIVSVPIDSHVSLWQTDFFGNPTVKYASFDGIDPIEDSFTQGVGGHDHYNWGFTKPGVYHVRLGAKGTRVGGGTVTGTAVFTFLVGDAAGEFVIGDYDRNGSVGPEDYGVWKSNFGTNFAAADGNGDGAVNAADYTIWRDIFASPPPSGLDSSAAVPEPGATVLLSVCVSIFSLATRLRRHTSIVKTT